MIIFLPCPEVVTISDDNYCMYIVSQRGALRKLINVVFAPIILRKEGWPKAVRGIKANNR